MSSRKDDLAHLKIPLENILSATNNFDGENGISKSIYCVDYKGQLLWSGDLIDICARRLNKERDEEDEQHATIKLNDDWEPKFSRFEQCMKIEASHRHNSFYTYTPQYMNGYGDPTYIETKSVNNKSDMYSFGIVLFEVLCGRDSIINEDYNKYLAPMAITHYREIKLNEIVDWDLWKQMDSQSFNIFAKIAYECLNEERSQRPNIDEIVPRLKKALELARENRPMMSSLKDDLAHLKIPLENILSATNNFKDENSTSTGEFCKEYVGLLLWSGDLIAICARRLNKETHDKDEQQFWMEISMLSILKHKNLVSLVGFCDENGEKIIVYRHEIRGSLSNYLSDPMLMTWVQRLKICVRLAHVLSYVHYYEPHDFSVIHRKISSATVLLNDEWEPKLSGFERSMKIKASHRHYSFHTNTSRYTYGYGDPTYIETNSVNHKSDMYSFGIVLFELLCGRESIIDNKDDNHLAPLAITRYQEKKLDNIIHQDLWKQMDLHSFKMFTDIAYECLNEERSRRPNIDNIVPRLEKALELARENRQIHSTPNHLAHLRIPLEDIESATNYFNEKNVVGEGGFGKRYKGQLLWSGELIDITARRLINKEWDEKEQQFWTEISMLSSLKHKNVVSIVGFCNEVGAETIMYKRSSRGRLDNYLSDPMLLTWVKRLEISIGVAHALSYIHYDEPRKISVLHQNISSYTVLLNDDLEPKLSGFEHSMKIKASERHHSFHTDSVWSTKGYTDPICLETNLGNHKSDIYSFGIILFELLCGRKSVSDDQDNKYLAPVAIFHYIEKILDGIIDPDLWKQMDPRSLNIFAETAYECLNEERSQRPNIDEIVTRLEKALELQLERENVMLQEYSSVVAEVQGTSSIHEEGSASHFTSTGVKSNSRKNTMSSLEYLSHSQLSFEDIKSATNNFPSENVIRKKTVGRVYQGRMLHSGQLIDIVARGIYPKYQKDESKKFRMEKSMISSLDHTNLVSLIGYCDKYMFTVYKKEANGSLNKYLGHATLTWMQRLKICLGVANALSYLHYDAGRDFSVIHCNIRSSKILLDDKWEPKLSGFEISLKNTVPRRHRLLLTRDIVKNEKNFGHLKIGLDLIKEATKNFDDTYCIGSGGFGKVYKADLEHFDSSNTSSIEGENHKDSLKLSLEDIKLATQAFSQDNIIGHGRFGNIYKGDANHAHGDNIIAAKRLERKSAEGDAEFMIELEILMEYKHENVIGLVGYCDEEDEKISVYEFASRGSLDKYLSNASLTWAMRLKICIDIVMGLKFLHGTVSSPELVIHRDINSSNILLFDDWKAKLADFGLSFVCPTNQDVDYVIDNVTGTNGYRDPLYSKTGFLTKESDIFSLGALLSFDGNGERNKMVSATTFSYINSCPLNWQSLPESRFGTVVEMSDISNLNINIKTNAQFLSPDVVYGVYLVFKFCDSRNFSRRPAYVNLKYRKGMESQHAYFATWRDKEWMMIELDRYSNQKEDVVFEFLLQSFSTYQYGDGWIYVEGVEFRAIEKVKLEDIGKLEEAPQVLKSKFSVDQLQQLPTKFKDILKNYTNSEDMFWLGKVNGKKLLMLSAKATIFKFSDVNLYGSRRSIHCRFGKVCELFKLAGLKSRLIDCQVIFRILQRLKVTTFGSLRAAKSFSNLSNNVRMEGLRSLSRVEHLLDLRCVLEFRTVEKEKNGRGRERKERISYNLVCVLESDKMERKCKESVKRLSPESKEMLRRKVKEIEAVNASKVRATVKKKEMERPSQVKTEGLVAIYAENEAMYSGSVKTRETPPPLETQPLKTKQENLLWWKMKKNSNTPKMFM
ncbi:kinase-like domain, phloem protein 2-like protein [Tanacetum coccineum]